MLATQNSPQRLPDELIAEIFRNKTLSCRDLFHCSLVSRNFVDSVNRSLYQHILVELDSDSIGITHEDDNRNTYDYTTSSWKLLRTLLDYPRLAKHVKELELDFACDRERGRGKAGNETSMPQALSTFLRLGSNVRNVIFGERWRVSLEIITVIKEHKSVTGLSVIDMNEEEEQHCAELLPHLKRLSIGELITNRSGGIGGKVLGWSSLDWLELHDGVETITEFPSLSASSSTLRTLLVPLNLALQLDYSQLPRLHELGLVDLASDHASGGRYDAATSFWRSLCKSPSLHTLAFDAFSEEFSFGYERALFEYWAGPRDPIPSLRIIRFKGGPRLDRANSLLSGPLATTLHNFVVPSSLRRPDARAYEVNKLRAIAGWCETVGVELVLADEPRVRWTLLCKLISFFRMSLYGN
jgi:hypothetical protein